MARTYQKQVCNSDNWDYIRDDDRVICWYEETEIIDWDLSPTSIDIQWQVGTPIPQAQNISVVFPELLLLEKYKEYTYKKVEYECSIDFKENEFIELVAPGKRLDQIIFDNEEKRNFNFQIRFKDFKNIPDEGVKTHITLKVDIKNVYPQYGEVGAKIATLETREIPISITKIKNNAPKSTPKVESVLNITLNNSTGELIGDTEISFFNHNDYVVFSHLFDASKGKEVLTDPNETYQMGMFSISFYEKVNKIFIRFALSHNYKEEAKKLGIDLTKNQTIIKEKNECLIQRESQYFTIKLNVINDNTRFSIDKKEFNFEVFREKKETKNASFIIHNPNRLEFTITHSDFLEITEKNEENRSKINIGFRTKNSEKFRIGLHKGFIKITSSAGTSQIISVELNVLQDVNLEIKDIYFCLDKDIISLRKKHNGSEFVQAKITMYFEGYGRKYQNTQVYDYVFFKDEVHLDIGAEVQDFFQNIPSLEVLNVSEQKLLQPKEIFKATRVALTLEEKNFKGEVLATHSFSDLFFLAGKKPKAFPFLTNATLRSTYTDAFISVSALTKDVKSKHLGQIASNLTDLSNIKDPLGVANFYFKRAVANQTYGATNIISKENLHLEPKPEPNQPPITAIFQNQNFCPDWFAFSGEYEQSINFEHQLSENVFKGEEFKAFVKEKRIYKLNTGWIFPNEVELLWELIKSPLCFLKIQGKWEKVIPITQKPLSFDNTKNLFSFVVEFQRIASNNDY
jgi:hypothetical protein